jgi:hypothetical protein
MGDSARFSMGGGWEKVHSDELIPNDYHTTPIGDSYFKLNQPERSKREDSIEKIIPPKLTRGMAISYGKKAAKIKRMAGVSPELLGCGALNSTVM